MRDGEQSALECMYISDYFVFKNMEILLFFSFKCKFKYNNYFFILNDREQTGKSCIDNNFSR